MLPAGVVRLDDLDGRLARVDHFQRVHAPLFQLLAHDSRERAYRRLVYIRHLEARWIELIARAHSAHDGNAQLLAAHDELELSRDRVDRVDDVGEAARQKPLGGVGPEVFLVNLDLGLRIDVEDAVARGLDLSLADGAAQGDDLTVDVRETDRVVVDENEVPHPGSGQGLGGVGAHAAQADDGDAGGGEGCEAFMADNQLSPGKSV